MDQYTEYLLDRIFEVRESYKNGDVNKEFYENVVAELIGSLSHYTIFAFDQSYNVNDSSISIQKQFTA